MVAAAQAFDDLLDRARLVAAQIEVALEVETIPHGLDAAGAGYRPTPAWSGT